MIEQPARARPRGGGHGARLRADARALRAVRDRRTRRSAVTAAAGCRGEGARPRRALVATLTRWARGRRFRARARSRLQRHHGRRGAAADPVARRCSTTSGRPSSTTSTAAWPRRSSCPTRSRRSGCTATARAASCAPTRASRRSTTWPTSSPTPRCSASSGSTAAEPIAVVRTPPAVSLYHRFENDLFGQVLERLRGTQTVVLPRTDEQRAELSRAGGLIVPERAIDAQSLIAYADLVVSAGGTMNREAVALGTPVFTVFEGRLGRGRRAADRRRPAAAAARRRRGASSSSEPTRRPSRPTASGVIPGCSSTCCSRRAGRNLTEPRVLRAR